MNPFQRARNEAHATRAKLAKGLAGTPIPARELLQVVESTLNVAVEQVAPTYPDLGGGSAVLIREQLFIYVTTDVDAWSDKYCALVAHELGHFYLDPSKAPTTVAHLDTLLGSEGSPGVMKVEAYGARERQELQANVFARELLLPRELARHLARSGMGPVQVAKQLGIPLEFARQQMLDALLLPELSSASSTLAVPSPDQLAAANAQERAANVIAGPGTGKTTTLIHRVKYLVEEKNIPPSEILVLTFTNKAAFELVERLHGAGILDAGEIWAGTFHAFGLEFLRKYHQHFQLEADLHVCDLLSSMTMLVEGLPRVNLGHYLRVEDPYDWLAPVIATISRLKEELVSPAVYHEFVVNNPSADVELQQRRLDVSILFQLHETLLAERGIVDFVDLISKPAIALKNDRSPFAAVADRFQHVLVDEYQDVTQAMVELLRQIAYQKSIWVVGDIRQAIHHWRGASLKSLLKFDTEFKANAGGTKVQRYPLSNNRRSTQEIVDLTQHVGRIHMLEASIPLDEAIATRGKCGEKPVVITCPKLDGVLGSVLQNILALHSRGITFGEQAVLCRGTHDVQDAAEALTTQGVPVIYIGELAQRTEIKQLLCFMQILVERRPKALIGLVGIPGLHMPMGDIQVLLKATEANVEFQRGRWLHTPPSGLSAQGMTVLFNLNQLIGKYRYNSSPWDFVCDLLLENRVLLPPATDDSVQAWVVRIALWQFAYGVRNGDGDRKEARLSRFLMRQRLRQRIGDSRVQRELPPEAGNLDGVRLMTVHGSKGLEFEAVHVAYVDASSYGPQIPNWQPEGILDILPPEALGSSIAEYESEAAIERNNLMYVAVSRAKRHLYLYQSNEYGANTIAPQLQHHPPKFTPNTYGGSALKLTKPAATNTFTAPGVWSFDDFDTYVTCSLRYWYSRILGLQSEAEIDVSMRARSAVMDALKSVASRESPSARHSLAAAWAARKLPSPLEDPMLWRDANFALDRGTTLISTTLRRGGVFLEPQTVVGGVTIDMPWGFAIKGPYDTEFVLIRFARRRVSDLLTLMKPMVPGLDLIGTKKMTMNYVLTDQVDDVPGGKMLQATKSYKAAVRLQQGDNSPRPGRQCARCSFSTICPSAP